MTLGIWPQVGMMARWLGEPIIPGGATWNPPPPGWKPPPIDPNVPRRNVDCRIVGVEWDDDPENAEASRHPLFDRRIVTRLRTPEGDEFDPRVDPGLCVPLAEIYR